MYIDMFSGYPEICISENLTIKLVKSLAAADIVA